MRPGSLQSWQGQHAVGKVIHLVNGLWEVSAERRVVHKGTFLYDLIKYKEIILFIKNRERARLYVQLLILI